MSRDTLSPERRAQELLPRVLNPEEQRIYRWTGKIVITGSEGGKYRIHKDHYVGNIEVLSDEVTVSSRFSFRSRRTRRVKKGSRLCAHPTDGWRDRRRNEWREIPLTDKFICQILAIKADEDSFLQTAHVYREVDW